MKLTITHFEMEGDEATISAGLRAITAFFHGRGVGDEQPPASLPAPDREEAAPPPADAHAGAPAPARPATGEAATSMKPATRRARRGPRPEGPAEALPPPVAPAPAPAGQRRSWSPEQRAKFKATQAAKRAASPIAAAVARPETPPYESRPRHSNGKSTPINPHVVGGKARPWHEED